MRAFGCPLGKSCVQLSSDAATQHRANDTLGPGPLFLSAKQRLVNDVEQVCLPFTDLLKQVQ
jgi:hypothetical protein